MKRTNVKRWLAFALALVLILGSFSGTGITAKAAAWNLELSQDKISSSGGTITVKIPGGDVTGLMYTLRERNFVGGKPAGTTEIVPWTTISWEKDREFQITIPANTEKSEKVYRLYVNDKNDTGSAAYKEITVVAAGGATTEADKTALDEAIQAAEALHSADYTEESWNHMQTALIAAKEVAGKADAAQAEVDEKTAALNKAVDELVEKSSETADASKIQAKVADVTGKAISGIAFELIDVSASNDKIADLTSDAEGNVEYPVVDLESGVYRLKMPFKGEYTCEPTNGYLYEVANGRIAKIDSEAFTGKEDIKFTLTKIGGETDPEEPQANAKTLLINVVDKNGRPFNETIFVVIDPEYPNSEGMKKAPSNGILKITVDSGWENGEIKVASSLADKYTIEPEKITFTAKNTVFQTVNGQAYDGTQTFTLKVTEKEISTEEKPGITSVMAEPENLPCEGGTVTLNITGTKLASNVNVKVIGVSETVAIQPIQILDGEMLQKFTVNFPANTSTEPKEYIITSAIKGDLWSTQKVNVTVAGKEEENPDEGESNANITSVKVTPEQVSAAGGTVKVDIEGTELTANNWGVEAKAYIAGMDTPMDRFRVEVSEMTANGAVLTIPQNTMVNDIEYRITAGAKNNGVVANQASTKVLQAGKEPSEEVIPETVEMIDNHTIIVTMEKNVKIGIEDTDALRQMFYIADHGNSNSNRINLTEEETITVEDNKITITFGETPNLKVNSALYVKEGALRTENGVNVREFSWIITSKPMITSVELEKEILDSAGGTVKAVLRGVRLSEVDDITARIMKAGSGTFADIEVEVAYGVEPTLTFQVPANETQRTESYIINLKMGGSPVYIYSVVSVLAANTDAKEQTLSAMTISGNNKTYTNENSTEIVVKVSKQEGELKTELNLYGTNLDATKTEVRAIDQNGIVWPVYHVPE